jgi:HK97 family phage prohead protease
MPDPIREYKAYSLLETKSEAAGKFTGYASTYGRDAYGDRILAGAFAESIKEQRGKIPIFMEHFDWIGVSTDLAEDAKGLYIEGQIALDTVRGRDAFALMQTSEKADFRVGLSIGFTAEEVEYDEATGARTLKKINLWETSITPFPANRGARVDSIKSLRNVEQILRDVGGCSKEGAKRAIALLQPYLLPDGSGSPPSSERDARTLRHLSDAAFRSALQEIANGR